MLNLLKNEKYKKLPLAVFFTLAIYTGCRKGELVGLEWKDIDFNNNVVSINRAYYCSWHKKEFYTDTTKTATSRRSLKLPDHVMETLRGLQEWQNKQREICGGSWVETDRVFTDWKGVNLTPKAPQRYLSAFCKRTGMRHINIHSFRHFNASALINSGVDVVTVQTALGHSKPSTTIDFFQNFENWVN